MAFSWLSQLLPASFRGIPFVVETSGFSTSRRLAIHEYPFKDNPYAEDMGRGNQNISFTGFLVGDDCYLKRDLLASACQEKGSGILIHPSLTFIPAAVITAATFVERVDRGRVVEVELNFLVVDDIPVLQLFSAATGFFASSPTLQLVATAVATVASASKAAFASILNPASLLIGLTETTISSLTGFSSRVISGLDPTAIFRSTNGMQVLADDSFTLSRYTSGNVDGLTNPILNNVSRALPPADRIRTATQDVLDNVVVQRASLHTAVDDAAALAVSDPDGAYLPAIYAIPEALRAAINEPKDQLRLLAGLASYQAAVSNGMNAQLVAVANGTASACRKGALMSLALGASSYQPTAAQDINTLLAVIVPLFDAEILYAADQNDYATYNALLSLRAAVVSDLQTRGSQLPELINVTETSNLPALVVAYQLYRDALRDQDLIRRVDPVHPLFMPLTFEVLSA